MKDECINCGAWKGLHHYETNQCPRDGQEAPLGKLQEWDDTVYQEDNTAELRATIANMSNNTWQDETVQALKQGYQATIEEQSADLDRACLRVIAKDMQIAELTRMLFALRCV